MQLERHGWDIHAVSAGRSGARAGICGHRNVMRTQEHQEAWQRDEGYRPLNNINAAFMA
jgi:hypothetical protein